MRPEEKEQAKLVWIRKNMPMIAAVMAIATFALTKFAGYSDSQAFVVGAIMFVFAIFTAKLREWFGVTGFIVVTFSLAVILWAVQEIGWL